MSTPIGPLRPRLRFSLRGMFVALTVVCLFLGHVEKRWRMMIAAETAGPLVHICSFDGEYDDRAERLRLVTHFWDSGILPGYVVAHYVLDEQTFAAICQLTTIKRLNFATPEPCDDWMRHLAPLQDLEALYLDCPQLTDRAIPEICKLRNLQELLIVDNAMTPEGILRLHNGLRNCVMRVVPPDVPKYVHKYREYLPLNGRIIDPQKVFPEMRWPPDD